MKLLGICEDCGTPYPVEVHEDDSIHILGSAGSCQCGSREFSLVTDHVEDVDA